MTLGIGGIAAADPGGGNANGNNGNDASATGQSVNASGNDDPSASAPGQLAKQAGTSPATTSAHSQGAEVAAAAQGNGKAVGRSDDAGTTDRPSGSDHSTGVGSNGTSGDYDQPQPVSRADSNPGGANGQCPGGPYCSTRDGSPSMNGNGNGKATGKPCAGCVGKADNKNPHGQMPNGSDHNAGYECDRNHGVGRGNPAHTGCQSTPPPPPTCEELGNCPKPPHHGCEYYGTCPKPPHHGCTGEQCVTPPGEESGPGPSEQPTPGVTVRPRPPEILGVEGVRHHAPPAAAPQVAAPTGASVLPSTGAGAGLPAYALAGLGLVAAGGATLAMRRRLAPARHHMAPARHRAPRR